MIMKIEKDKDFLKVRMSCFIESKAEESDDAKISCLGKYK